MTCRVCALLTLLLLFVPMYFLSSCGDKEHQAEPPVPRSNSPATGQQHENATPDPVAEKVIVAKEKQPDRVLVDYAIIGFEGSDNPIGKERSEDEARSLATLLEQRYRSGTSLSDILVELKNTGLGSIGAGQFILLNYGVIPVGAKIRELPREKQPGLAKAAFALKPGEVTIVPHHPQDSPLGYWVVKRLQ